MRRMLTAPAVASVLILAACGGGAEVDIEATVGPGPSPTEATAEGAAYVGVEYEFQGPDELASGSQTVALENQGEEQHELQLLRLEEGRSIQDVEALFAADAPSQGIPDWATHVGGTYSEPGASASFEAEVEAGTYVMVCLIPAEDGVPHAAKGMVKQVTVA